VLATDLRRLRSGLRLPQHSSDLLVNLLPFIIPPRVIQLSPQLARIYGEHFTGNGVRTVIVETATASPAISRFMTSAYGAPLPRHGANRGTVNIAVPALGHRPGESDSQWSLSVHSDI